MQNITPQNLSKPITLALVVEYTQEAQSLRGCHEHYLSPLPENRFMQKPEIPIYHTYLGTVLVGAQDERKRLHQY